MKTKAYLHSKRGIMLFFAVFTFAFTQLRAQVFIPATSYEDIYPTTAPKGTTPHCYSFGNVYFGGPTYDTYISGQDGAVIWRMTNIGNPAAIFNQGVIPYPNCVDVSVGFMYDMSSQAHAIVSYYKNGTGHFYDVYKWTVGGLSLVSSTQISFLPVYTRISMDSHKTYGLVIVWEEATDIYALTGLNCVFNGPILLGGTGGMKRPDVAFSHGPAALNVQFVYNLQTSPTTYDIYESVADFFTLNSSAFYTPTVQDINPIVAMWSEITASIDCPDHYSVENWAYTYGIDGVDIYTRSVDFNSLGFPVTTNVVNGTLGNVPMPAKELGPRIAYNQSCKSFHVAWYSSYFVLPNGQCYFTEEIKESAFGLVSNPDYELVAANSAFPPGASLNSIAFSKQNDNTPYLYTVFLTKKGTHHVFHKWPLTSSFRTSDSGNPNDPQHLADNCGAQHAAVVATNNSKLKELAVGPNPFSGQVSLYVPASMKNETMSLRLIDITGKLYLDQQCPASEASAIIENASHGLHGGTYFLSATVESMDVHQNFKLQCVENK